MAYPDMAKTNPLEQGLESLTKPPPDATAPKVRAALPKALPADRRVLIGGFFSPEVHRQFRVLAAELGETQQNLLADALDMIFTRHQKPAVARFGQRPAHKP